MIEIVKVVLDTYISTHNAGVEISNLLEMMPKLHAMKVDLAKIGLNNIYDPTIESLTVRHDILLGSVKNIVESGVLNGLLEPQFKEYFLQNSGSMKSKEWLEGAWSASLASAAENQKTALEPVPISEVIDITPKELGWTREWLQGAWDANENSTWDMNVRMQTESVVEGYDYLDLADPRELVKMAPDFVDPSKNLPNMEMMISELEKLANGETTATISELNQLPKYLPNMEELPSVYKTVDGKEIDYQTIRSTIEARKAYYRDMHTITKVWDNRSSYYRDMYTITKVWGNSN